jgi:hypothetical protein
MKEREFVGSAQTLGGSFVNRGTVCTVRTVPNELLYEVTPDIGAQQQ